MQFQANFEQVILFIMGYSKLFSHFSIKISFSTIITAWGFPHGAKGRRDESQIFIFEFCTNIDNYKKLDKFKDIGVFIRE